MGRPRYKSKVEVRPIEALGASTSIAHIILAGTSAWTWKYCDPSWPFSYVSYIMLFGHSLIGTAYYVQPESSDTLRKICKFSTLIVEACPIPFLVSDLFLLKGESSPLAYAPAISAVVPIVGSLVKQDYERIFVDATVGLNLCGLLYFAIKYESPWTYGLFTLGVLNQFVFSQICEKYEVPRIDLVAIGLTFFCMFSINTICDAI